jgi:hypothetical protein
MRMGLVLILTLPLIASVILCRAAKVCQTKPDDGYKQTVDRRCLIQK